jgi:hypothetical protein
MNTSEVLDQMSCTSLSICTPTDDVCEEKSISVTPKQRMTTADTIGTSYEQQQRLSLPKNVHVDLKQQFSNKLKLDGGGTIGKDVQNRSSIDHHPIKPVRSITPKRNTNVDDSVQDCHTKHQTERTPDCASFTSATAPSSASSMSAITPPRRSKHVCFITDRKGHLICDLFKNKDPKTKQETIDCFYQMHDFQQFRRECKQEAILQQKTTAYRDNFSAVYAACTTGNFKNVTRERAYISAASCRGLEVVVFPTLHVDRKNTIATVLRTQKALPISMLYSDRCEAIAAASRYLSKQARQLARVFGSGDAAVVIANRRIETQHQPNSECDVDHNRSTPTNHPSRRKSKSGVVVPQCFVSC